MKLPPSLLAKGGQGGISFSFTNSLRALASLAFEEAQTNLLSLPRELRHSPLEEAPHALAAVVAPEGLEGNRPLRIDLSKFVVFFLTHKTGPSILSPWKRNSCQLARP